MKFKQEEKHLWNTFDDVALYINMYRRSGETNKDLAKRFLLTRIYPGDSTEQGIKYALYSTFYLEPTFNIPTSFAILKYRPLSQEEAIRYNSVYEFSVTDMSNNPISYELLKDNYGKPLNVVKILDNFSGNLKILYRYYDKETKTVVRTTERFSIYTSTNEYLIHVYKLYNEEEAYVAGVIDENNNLTNLGKIIQAELEGAIKLRWGKFMWNWDPWDYVGILNKENILITPRFDAAFGGFDEYNKIS